MTWTVSVYTGDPAPAPANAQDAFDQFLLNPDWRGLIQSGSLATGYRLSLAQTRQFNRATPDGGLQSGSRKLRVEATIELKELKCLLNDAMMQNALANLLAPDGPPGVSPDLSAMQAQYQTHQTGPDAYSFDLVQDFVAGGTSGFAISGTAEVVDHSYRVTATITREGETTPIDQRTSTVAGGCATGGNASPGLNLAFTESAGVLLLGALNGEGMD
jgi:hypothetical protein